jgi:uncharacterized repeat protein (TIGR02543 family)
MKTNFTKIFAALALLVTLAIPMGMWGQTRNTVSWNASQQNYTNQQSVTSATFDNNISAAFEGGVYYNTGTAVRVYGGKTFTISASNNYTITEIAITFGSGDGSNTITANTGSYESGTWTGTASSVVFTVGGSSGHRRLKVFNVTYSSAGGPTYTVTFNTNGGTFVGSNAFQNLENHVVAGTYILPSATKFGYTFTGWLATGASTPVTGSYEVTGDVAFTAQWETGSIGTINFGSNATKINSANVTGTDSQNNSWTITTVGTTSFTQHADCSQVGSSGSPATSITFTTTLPSSVNVMSFSARFGGYGGTVGDVTLKVGSTVVGTGSLNGTNIVEVQSTSQEVGTVLTVIVDNIDKGVNCYWISYTISDANAPTITFNPNTIDLGNVPAGEEVTTTFDVIQSNLTSGITLTASNGQLNPSYIAQGNGTTTVTWTCTPTAGSINVTITATSGSINPTMTITGAAKTVHDVNITASQNGSVSASPASAIEGETITLSVTPASGYYLSALNVVNASTSEVISVSNNTFSMPDADVTVSATFGLIVPSTVSFSINGKIEMTATVNSSANVSIDMTKFVADVTTNGYVFNGWYTQANGGTKIPDTYQPSGDITVYAQFGVPASDAYELVTDASQLVAGNLVVIAAAASDYAISTTQNSNNRARAAITKSGTTITLTSDVCEFVLGGSTGAWTFYDGDGIGGDNGFIYAASSSSNHLKTQANSNANGQWAITFTDNVTKVVAQGTNTHNDLRYNSSNSLFSCYLPTNTDMANVCLYTKPASNSKATRDVTANSKVTAIDADVIVRVKANGIVYLTGSNAGNETNLVVEDGGQLVSSAAVAATMLKTVAACTYNNQNSAGYVLIASPLGVAPTAVANMTTGNYDLYAYYGNEELEWQNYKANSFNNLGRGRGYLYANGALTTLEFAGSINGSFSGINNLNYESGNTINSLNLVGNPFAYEKAFSVYDNSNNTVDANYLSMNDAGNGFLSGTISTSITLDPMEAIFVQATAANESFKVYTAPGDGIEPSANNDGLINLSVSRNRGSIIDNAIVRFGEGLMLNKFRINQNATELYVTMGGNDYSIVNTANDGEMPVSFKAETNGTYTLSADITELEMNYLHLIDNMTGADVDLLATPSYTFDARTTDYASRFKLVFSANGTNENTMDNNTTFAYFNGSEWTVDNTGEATLQVIDVLGRLVNTQTINGNTTLSLNQTPGIYMLRLVNGNDVKVQKIVVR